MNDEGFTLHGRHQQCDFSLAVQTACFDLDLNWQDLRTDTDSEIGAELVFIGRVRATEPNLQLSIQQMLSHLELSHYAAMTQASFQQLCCNAASRWPLMRIAIIHRIGKLAVGEPIVKVMVSSQHRVSAFEAAQYLMDTLKTTAPFWKKAIYQDGSEHWIEQKQSDSDRAQRW